MWSGDDYLGVEYWEDEAEQQPVVTPRHDVLDGEQALCRGCGVRRSYFAHCTACEAPLCKYCAKPVSDSEARHYAPGVTKCRKSYLQHCTVANNVVNYNYYCTTCYQNKHDNSC